MLQYFLPLLIKWKFFICLLQIILAFVLIQKMIDRISHILANLKVMFMSGNASVKERNIRPNVIRIVQSAAYWEKGILKILISRGVASFTVRI